MKPKVVIVGAGFGGINLARHLRKAPVDVLLIDKHNYHTFQPLLYQVATAGLEAEEIAHAVRGIFHKQNNFDFFLGEVTGVDWGRKHVIVKDGTQIDFDYLVLAAGATTNFFGVEGAEAHGYGLKNLAEAVNLRSHIISCFEEANRNLANLDLDALNVVVVGGGPTGVEMAGAICELFQKVLARDFPNLPVDKAQVYLIEASSNLLNAYHPKLQPYAVNQLKRRGVNVMLDTQVVKVTADAVHLGSGQTIPTQTMIWAAGIRANPLAETLGIPTTRGGRIIVDHDLSVPGFEQTYAIGDMAASKNKADQIDPQLAPVAMQGGKHVADQIARHLKGSTSSSFSYQSRGIMATIGRNAAVSQLDIGIRNTGFIAWIMWLVLHLMQLVGFRNRLNVLLNWAWNYFTYDRSARLIMPAIDPDHEDTTLKIEAREPEIPVM
ncbi:MAG: NAD(P)/FAD-dependent oxidoreductase [Rhodothermales bacterium]